MTTRCNFIITLIFLTRGVISLKRAPHTMTAIFHEQIFIESGGFVKLILQIREIVVIIVSNIALNYF